MQLPPVKQRRVYSVPKSLQNKALFNSTDNIWNNLESVVLKVNHRQGEGNKWTNCLNRLRMGEITQEDKELLESRRLKNFPDKDLDDALHVFGTNIEADEVNMTKLNALPGKLVISKAKVEGPKSWKPKITAHGTFEEIKYKDVLKMKIGAKAMLINNVSLQDSLVNGVTGTIIDILYHKPKEGEEKKKIMAVVLKFNNPKIGESTREKYEYLSDSIRHRGGVPIFLTPLSYSIPGRSANHGCQATITQFPLLLAYALTAHKLQGVTIKKGQDLYIHKTKWIREGMAYVMLSRCEDIENVYLDDDFPLKCIIAEERNFDETMRLEAFDICEDKAKERFNIYYQNIASLRNKIEDLNHDIHPNQSDFICLVETWLDKGTNVQWPGKHFHQASVGEGRGACIFAPEKYDYELVGRYAEEKFQILSIIMKKKVQLFLIYLSKGWPVSEVKEAIAKIHQINMPTVMVGDFNFDKTTTNGLTTYLNQLGLKQIITQPTQERGNTIDHCYVSQELLKDIKTTCQFTYYSDHASISIQLENLYK